MRTGPFAPHSHTGTGQALATLRMLADAWPFKEFAQVRVDHRAPCRAEVRSSRQLRWLPRANFTWAARAPQEFLV